MDFNGILTNLTYHNSNNFYNQIVFAQSIQIKEILTLLMNMNSALSLLFKISFF